MRALFDGDPSGTLVPPTLLSALARIAALAGVCDSYTSGG
jgi:hypothetical protein